MIFGLGMLAINPALVSQHPKTTAGFMARNRSDTKMPVFFSKIIGLLEL